MKKCYLFICLFAALYSANLTAQNTLATHFPQSWWAGEGTTSFESADIRVFPKGLYVDIELEMVVMCGHLGFGDTDSLEAVWHFELPTDATITDSYLWIDEVKVPAGIYERETGTLIYEEIVNRRQDPSLLLKMRDGHYQLRIYPVPNFTSRRFQINYRVPVRWYAGEAHYQLPVAALQAAGQFSNNFPVRISVAAHDLLTAFSCNNTDLVWTTDTNNQQVCDTYIESLRKTDRLGWPWSLGTENSWLALDTSTQSYQLLYQPPSELQAERAPVDLLLVYAFEEEKSMLTLAEMKAMLGEAVAQSWQEGDRLIIFRPGGLAEGDRYIDLTSALNAIAGLASYSNIPVDALCESAQDYFSNRAHPILLLTSSLLSFGQRNGILEDLRQPIFVGDLSEPTPTIEYQFDRFQFRRYEEEIARQSGGFYTRLGGASDRLMTLFSNLLPESPSRIYYAGVAPEQGFAYDQHWIGDATLAYSGSPWMQSGRYAGAGNLQFQAHLLQHGMPLIVNEPIEVNSYSNTTTWQTWQTVNLLAKERSAASSSDQWEVIDISLTERLLTTYTVFLALDPAIVADQECVGCDVDFEQWIVINTEEPTVAEKWQIVAYPNPFLNQLSLRWTTPSDSRELSCELLDMQGRSVLATTIVGPFSEGVELGLWRARELSTLPTGVYFLRLHDGEDVQTWRVVKAFQ